MMFLVGQTVRVKASGWVGEIYAIRPGSVTGIPIASVKFVGYGSKGISHGFYYLDQIERESGEQ